MSNSTLKQSDVAREANKLPVLESGVLPKGVSAQLDRPPPWEIVQAYLATGQHRGWIEGFARRSPAFAEVLAALRNDAEERAEEKAVANVAPLRRR